MSFHGKKIQLLGIATVGPKGQVVIPVEARDTMKVKPGDKLVALYLEDHKTVAFVDEREMQTMIDRMGAHVNKISNLFKNIR